MPAGAVARVETPGTELARFETDVRRWLEQFGLPTEQLFVPVDERISIISNVGSVLAELDSAVRAHSNLVSSATRIPALTRAGIAVREVSGRPKAQIVR